MDINAVGTATTLIPDIGTSAPASQPLDDQSGIAGSATPSFKDTLTSMLEDVNTKEVDADQKAVARATGMKGATVEEAAKSAEEASLSFQLTLAVRNKILDAYTQIERMQF
jgi:flagellar hook-basal body complex protein FliE